MTLPSEHCHTAGVFMVANLKKDRQNIIQITLNVETLSIRSNLINDTSFGALLHSGVFMVANLKKTDIQNLNLMTLNVEPC